MLQEDTIKIVDKATAIKQKMVELDLLVNKYYGKIASMPVNKVWIGPNCEKFIQRVLVDKSELLKYSSGIKKIADELINFTEQTDVVVKAMEERL